MGTMVGWIALLVGIVALGYAWKLHHELSTAARRLDRYNRALFDASDEIRSLREEMASQVAQLRVDILQRSGAFHFSPEMTVREAQLLHPQAQQVLAGFHLGGCSSCAVDPDDTLASVCATSGLDVNLLMNNLNSLLGAVNSQNGATTQPVKTPNVQLTL